MLTTTGEAFDVDLHATLADDPTFKGTYRLRVAKALAVVGDKRAAGLLAAMANDPALSRLLRLRAAKALNQLGDQSTVQPKRKRGARGNRSNA